MKTHRNAIRYNNEWQCHCCAKSWGVKDDDPPDCLTDKEYRKMKLDELRTFLYG